MPTQNAITSNQNRNYTSRRQEINEKSIYQSQERSSVKINRNVIL
jgi:hypothetical protein